MTAIKLTVSKLFSPLQACGERCRSWCWTMWVAIRAPPESELPHWQIAVRLLRHRCATRAPPESELPRRKTDCSQCRAAQSRAPRRRLPADCCAAPQLGVRVVGSAQVASSPLENCHRTAMPQLCARAAESAVSRQSLRRHFHHSFDFRCEVHAVGDALARLRQPAAASMCRAVTQLNLVRVDEANSP